MACQNDVNSTSQNIMQLSKYHSTWLNVSCGSCHFINMVQLLEIYYATQKECLFFGNMYNHLRKVMDVG